MGEVAVARCPSSGTHEVLSPSDSRAKALGHSPMVPKRLCHDPRREDPQSSSTCACHKFPRLARSEVGTERKNAESVHFVESDARPDANLHWRVQHHKSSRS